MKKIISIFMMLLFTAMTYSQELSVNSIRQLENDLTARTSPRQDANGDDCALIKIDIPSVKGLIFEGWVIGDVSYNAGVYRVYVPAGTKKLKYAHEDYIPGEIVFPMHIESKCVYEVIMSPPDNDTNGWISVNMQANSQLKINDETYACTVDGVQKIQLPFGKYKYEITAKNCTPKTGEVVVNEKPEFIDGRLAGSCEIIIQAIRGTQLIINNIGKGTLKGNSKIHLGPGKYKFIGIVGNNKKTVTIKIVSGQDKATVDLRPY